MLTQTKRKKENKQLPAFSVLVSSVSDITETGSDWLAPANVVDFGYFPCVLGQVEVSHKKTKTKEEEESIFLHKRYHEKKKCVCVCRLLVFCKWDMPIVLCASFKNVLLCANEKAR